MHMCSFTVERIEAKEEETIEAEGAVTIGIIGIVLCCSILGAVVVLDLATIHRHFTFMKKNIDDFLYRRGWRKRKPGGKRRSKRQSTRNSTSTHPNSSPMDGMGDHYGPEPRDASQIEIRLDNDGRLHTPMPLNNVLTAQLDVNGLKGHGLSRLSDRTLNYTENNFTSLDRKSLESKYHKALTNYTNLELSQTQL